MEVRKYKSRLRLPVNCKLFELFLVLQINASTNLESLMQMQFRNIIFLRKFETSLILLNVALSTLSMNQS